MVSASGRYVITYNGEIYNYRALRRELEISGYPFRGHSDTEVLLAAVEHWGFERALHRISGMFALAVWDRKGRVLILARDRVGKKPLYYGWCNNTLLFASELKALRCHPDFDNTLDHSALAQYIQYGWLAQPASVFRNVRKLPQGSFIRISMDDRPWSPKPRRYWSAKDVMQKRRRALFSGSYEEALERLEDILVASVHDRMVADVDLGALLSGGVDSSLVVALMRQSGSRPGATFSIGFWEPKYNEAEYAAQVARHLGTRHHELYVTPEQSLDIIGRLPQIYDEPFADISQIPTYLVSELARSEVKVVLSGDGGDELFAGYTRYFECLRRWRRSSRLPLKARHILGAAIDSLGRYSWELCKPLDYSHERKLPKWRRLGSKLQRHACDWHVEHPQQLIANTFTHGLYGCQMIRGAGHQDTLLGDSSQWVEGVDPLHAMMHYDFGSYLADDILVKVDRASMAVGLEVRCPLLDSRLIEFAWSLPNHYLVDDRGGKRILKDVLRRHVPQTLIDRPKRGFSVPVADWLRGSLRPWAEDLLDISTLQRQGIFNAGSVHRLWRQHLCRWRNHTNQLWAILMFQAWLLETETSRRDEL